MTTQKKDSFDKIILAFNIGQIIITLYLMHQAVDQNVNNGNGSLNSWLTGIGLAVIVALFSFAVNKGSKQIERITNWLEKTLKIYPTFRRTFIIAPGVASAPLWTYWAITKMEGGFIEKLLVALFFGIVLPAAIVSLVSDDRLMEKSPLSKYCTLIN